jgi:hypothetical protein
MISLNFPQFGAATANFGTSRTELERVEQRFQQKFRSTAGFHLAVSPSEEFGGWGALPLKAEDRNSGIPDWSEERVSDRGAAQVRARHEPRLPWPDGVSY